MNENDVAVAVEKFLENDLSSSDRRTLQEADPATFVSQVRLSVHLAAHHHDPADRRVVERTRELLEARERNAGLRTLKEVQRRIGSRPRAGTLHWAWVALAAAGLLVAALFALRPDPPKVENQVHVPVPMVPRPEEKPPVAVPEPPKPTPVFVPPVEPPPKPEVVPVPPLPVPEPPRPAPAETKVAVARIESMTGMAFSGRKPLRAGQDLLEGEGVQTNAGAKVAIVFADKTHLELGAQTTLRGLGNRLHLDRGTLRAQVARPMEVMTPHGAAKVLGTVLRLDVGDSTRLEVVEGKVQLTRLTDARTVEVSAGEYAATADLVAYANPVVIDLDQFGTGRDCKPAEGPDKKLYRDESLGATGGTCIAAPGIGTALEGALPVTPGAWHLWIRYRDNDRGPIGFQVLVEGRSLATINGEGLLNKPGWAKWNWRQVSFETKNKNPRLTIRSNSEATGWDRPDRTWVVANRWDLIVLTRDPGFDPR